MKNTSLRYTLLLSDYGIAFKEMEQGIFVFIVSKDEDYYMFRYRKDIPIRFVTRRMFHNLSDNLENFGFVLTSGWNLVESFDDTEIVNKLNREMEKLK